MLLPLGAYGREVARMSRRNVESQFLCGLLHTIGKPIVLKAVAEIQDLIALSLSREEIDELLDEFHCPIGLSVAQKWKLPRPVQISISCYRNYSEATEFRDQTAMTYLADRLATWAVLPEKLPTAKAIDDPVFADLNFYPEDIEALLDRKGEILEIVAAMQDMIGQARFDIIVIGSGPGGQKAAIQGAKAGKRVAIVDREPNIGGACVYPRNNSE